MIYDDIFPPSRLMICGDLWQRLVDHSRGGLLEPKLSQELLDTPSVPDFDGLIVGNLTGYAIAMAK